MVHHRNVTVPLNEKITRPIAQLLEQLLPVQSKPTPAQPDPTPKNAFAEALKKVQNQARTQNNAEAFVSTTSGVSVPKLASFHT